MIPPIVVTPDDGDPFVIQPRQSDIARLERDVDRAFFRIELGYDSMFRLAHLALVRTGHPLLPDLETFMDTVTIDWTFDAEE